jgi:hypothetical protein
MFLLIGGAQTNSFFVEWGCPGYLLLIFWLVNTLSYCRLTINCVVGYQFLTRMGYNKVRRYDVGIADWKQAGYPLEENFVS